MDRNKPEGKNKKMVRLFIALLFPDPIKSELGRLVDDLRPRGQGIKWVEAKNIHLTLKFIGEVPEEKIGPITEAMKGTLAGRKKSEGRLIGCGGFPNLRNPRVVWVGLEGAESAAEIARDIERALVPLGIPAEKRGFSPHLTLGRIKWRADLSALTKYMESLNFDAGPVILNRVALVKSTLTPSGPLYENLKVVELE